MGRHPKPFTEAVVRDHGRDADEGSAGCSRRYLARGHYLSLMAAKRDSNVPGKYDTLCKARVCSPAAAGSRDGWEAVEGVSKGSTCRRRFPAAATTQRIGGVVRHRVDSQDKQDWHRRSRYRTAALPGLLRTVATSACLHVKNRRWRALQSACVTGTPLEIKNTRDRTRHVDHHQNEQRQE